MEDGGDAIERIVRAKKAEEKRVKEEIEREAVKKAQDSLSVQDRWPSVRKSLQKAIEIANKALERSEAHVKFHYQENPLPGDGAVSRGTLDLLSNAGGNRLTATILGMDDGRVFIEAKSSSHTHIGFARQYQPRFDEATQENGW